MNSHLISRVLLKNFANHNNKIRVFNKKTDSFSTKHIEEVGNIETPDMLFSESEREWNYKIENRIGNLLAKYHGDFLTIWQDEASHPVLKRLISIHFVRSFNFLFNLGKAAKEKVLELQTATPPHLCEIIAKDFLNDVVTSTPKMMKNLYNLVKSELDNYEIEIAEASKGENFIIGDSPILNNRRAVLDSQFFMLPVSPRFMISVTQKKRYWHLCEEDTRKFKMMIKHDAINYWLCLPKD